MYKWTTMFKNGHTSVADEKSMSTAWEHALRLAAPLSNVSFEIPERCFILQLIVIRNWPEELMSRM
jgi:hypothetical protein